MKSKLMRMMKTSTLLTVAAAIVLAAMLSSCNAPDTAPEQTSQRPGRVNPTGAAEQSEQTNRAVRAAVVEDFSGTVDAMSNNVEMAAFQGMALVREDSLSTGAESWASLEMTSERFALVGESSEVMVTSLIDGTAENTVFYMDRGTLWVGVKDRLSPEENIIVQTPSVALSVRGTAFSIAARGGVTEINIFRGEVNIRTQDMSGESIFDEHGVQTDISLTAGQSVSITVAGGVVTSVEVSELASVSVPDDVRDKLETLMPGTFADSSGDERLTEIIDSGDSLSASDLEGTRWRVIRGDWLTPELRFMSGGSVEFHDLEDEPNTLEARGTYTVSDNLLFLPSDWGDGSGVTIVDNQFTWLFTADGEMLLTFEKVN